MMKKTACILAIILIGIVANAQEVKRFSFATTIGTGIDMSKPSSTPFVWQVTGHYNLNSRFAVGVGTGLAFYEKMLIPLFADAKFLIIKPKRFTPFLQCGVGYSFAPDKHANGGFYLNPSVGMQYTLPKDRKLFLALGYESQKLERLKTYKDSFLAIEFAEELRHNLISVKVGFIF